MKNMFWSGGYVNEVLPWQLQLLRKILRQVFPEIYNHNCSVVQPSDNYYVVKKSTQVVCLIESIATVFCRDPSFGHSANERRNGIRFQMRKVAQPWRKYW
jgi:hypothetical protein